jgi:hypothetical protein
MRVPSVMQSLLAVLFLGCGSSTPAETPAATVDDVGVSDDVGVAETSGTACGRLVGQTLCDIDSVGYFRAGATTGTAKEGESGPFKLSEILAKGTEKYAFIFLSGYW